MVTHMKKMMRVLALLVALIVIGMNSMSSGASTVTQLKQSIEEKENAIKQAKNEKNSLKSGLTDLNKVLKNLKNTKADLATYVSTLDKTLADTEAHIETLHQKITDKEAEIAEARTQLENARQDEESQYQDMKKRIRFMYEKGDIMYAELFLSADGFEDFLNKADYIKQISAYDRKMLVMYQDSVRYVELCNEMLDAEEEVLNEAKELAEEEQASLEALIEEKKKEIERYEASIEGQEQLVREYETEIAAQNAAIEELERLVVAERKKLQDANKAVRNYDGGVFYWPAPSYTRVSDDYGDRIHPILKTSQFHNGVDLAAPSGTDILAAYDGEVISASYTAAMGNYIMIDHGDELYTIYMHASKLNVSQGDIVVRGQKIATVGSTGRSTGPHLHFSVRKEGSYVSPWNYIKLP